MSGRRFGALTAGPFVLSALLAIALGPSVIDSPHGSFSWLELASLAAAALMFRASAGLRLPVGLATLGSFPVLAGLGFNFAPDWARPLVAIIFYGSIAASVLAVFAGAAAIVGPLYRRGRGAFAGLTAMLLLVPLAIAAGTAAPSGATERPSPAGAHANNMGLVINTARREAEPSFTADGGTMYFNCNDSQICVSRLTGRWEDGNWSVPELVGPPISTDYTEVEPWIDAAGDKLYFNSTRPFASGMSLPGLALYVDAIGLVSMALDISPFGGLGLDDIWVTYRVDDRWSAPRNLSDVPGEPPVNTIYMDHCLAFSADGNEAFWTSTRPGGFGRNDIWTSRHVDGKWTPAENMGPAINSPASEHHSMPSPDGKSLYVTSDRPSGFGGEDTYVSRRGSDGSWGPLVNLGAGFNGPGNDRCPTFTPDGTIVVFDSDRKGGFGSKDLWWLYAAEIP